MSYGLKPCPFCGGEARIIAKPYEPKVCVGCDDDTCLGFSGLGWLYDSEKEATEAWNRRAERTCRMGAPIDGEYRCGECGHLNRETYRADKGWHPPEYCAHCGARAVEGDA